MAVIPCLLSSVLSVHDLKLTVPVDDTLRSITDSKFYLPSTLRWETKSEIKCGAVHQMTRSVNFVAMGLPNPLRFEVFSIMTQHETRYVSLLIPNECYLYIRYFEKELGFRFGE